MEVAADWHELMVPRRDMQPSTARDSGQVDPRRSTTRHFLLVLPYLIVLLYDCILPISFYPRDAMLARVIGIATCLSVCLSVCPSVCPSRAGIMSKRRKLASWFLHHLVAPRF